MVLPVTTWNIAALAMDTIHNKNWPIWALETILQIRPIGEEILSGFLSPRITGFMGHPPRAGDAWSMPDQDSVTFWQQVAGIYKNYRNVLFEIYNEPHWLDNWPCWRNGCAIVGDYSGLTGHDHSRYNYQAVGMQTLLDIIRLSGANNLVVVGGIDWGFDLSQ